MHETWSESSSKEQVHDAILAPLQDIALRAIDEEVCACCSYSLVNSLALAAQAQRTKFEASFVDGKSSYSDAELCSIFQLLMKFQNDCDTQSFTVGEAVQTDSQPVCSSVALTG